MLAHQGEHALGRAGRSQAVERCQQEIVSPKLTQFSRAEAQGVLNGLIIIVRSEAVAVPSAVHLPSGKIVNMHERLPLPGALRLRAPQLQLAHGTRSRWSGISAKWYNSALSYPAVNSERLILRGGLPCASAPGHFIWLRVLRR